MMKPFRESGVWRLSPGTSGLIISVSEELASQDASGDDVDSQSAIYFFADLEGSAKLTHTEDTMFKVHRALVSQGLTEKQIISAISAMQNEGLYFREAAY